MMPNNPSPPPPRSGLSLYANLLDPNSSGSGTISSAPVTYSQPADGSSEQDDAAKKQQALAASLRFQPTKRPQVAAQKAKAKAIASKFAIPPTSANDVSASTPDKPIETIAPKTTIADWTATVSDDDVNNLYGERRQRGGRKKRKKNKETREIQQDWDDIYDPSRPNNFEEYKHSEEKIREIRDWKDLLYKHRTKRRESSSNEDDASDKSPVRNQYAPPSMSFAPPPKFDDDHLTIPLPPSELPDDATGDAVYARRMQMKQIPPPPPPISRITPDATPSPPPPPPPGQISRSAIRYVLPSAPDELPKTEAELEENLGESKTNEDETDQSHSKRPGQVGFAERLMSKYGWTKGQGLGAHGTGIINPLYAKADKRKKKADAEGGGFATPANTGKILGGNKSKIASANEEGKFGAMSEVIRLENMLQGLDLEEELDREEGGIMQEIGEECGEKYGAVQRVYIHSAVEGVQGPIVFVHFTSQLSALRAVNALEGRIFNGNTITARFWPKEKYDDGEYS